MATPTYAPVRDTPTETNTPESVPRWFVEYRREMDKWCREMALALRQSQQKVNTMENTPTP